MQEDPEGTPTTDDDPTPGNVGEQAQQDLARDGSDIKQKLDRATEKAREAIRDLPGKD